MMVAYNFQARFAPAVESGKKTQTIRADRKYGHAKAGDKIQLYTGMRSPKCRKLIDPDPTCILSIKCSIFEFGFILDGSPCETVGTFAQEDGFHSFVEMKDWFRGTHGLPFHGQLIKWKVADRVG